MSNQNVGVEVNGGGRNDISEVNVTIRGSGKGVVLNDTYGNKVQDITVLFDNEIQFLNELKSKIESIDDASINNLTNKSYKEESIAKINSILTTPTNRDDLKTRALDLMTIISGWFTIQSTLYSQLHPYISDLQKMIVG